MLKRNLFFPDTYPLYRVLAAGQPHLHFLPLWWRIFPVMPFLMAFFSQLPVYQLHAQVLMSSPSSLEVYPVQDLSFGSFFTGSSGGTVVITPEGNRTVTGTVIALPSSPGTPAIFEVRLVPNRMVHIAFPSSVTLHRVGGSEGMTVTGFTSDKPGNSFVTKGGHPFINQVRVGATLNVGTIHNNPADNYTGSFTVTFIEE